MRDFVAPALTAGVLFALLTGLAACGGDRGDGEESGGDDGNGGASDASSDESPVAACSDDACGGDLVGSWTIAGGCVHPGPLVEFYRAALLGFCVEPEFSVELRTSGTMNFHDDQTYEIANVSEIVVLFAYPRECIDEGTTSCEELGGDNVACTGTIATSCACEMFDTDGPAEDSVEGTWSTSGDTLTLQPSGGEAADSRYCRRDGRVAMTATVPFADQPQDLTTLLSPD